MASPSTPRLATGREIGAAICQALGMDPSMVEGLELHCSATEMARVQVTRLISIEEATEIAKILEDYELIERGQAQLS